MLQFSLDVNSVSRKLPRAFHVASFHGAKCGAEFSSNRAWFPQSGSVFLQAVELTSQSPWTAPCRWDVALGFPPWARLLPSSPLPSPVTHVCPDLLPWGA